MLGFLLHPVGQKQKPPRDLATPWPFPQEMDRCERCALSESRTTQGFLGGPFLAREWSMNLLTAGSIAATQAAQMAVDLGELFSRLVVVTKPILRCPNLDFASFSSHIFLAQIPHFRGL